MAPSITPVATATDVPIPVSEMDSKAEKKNQKSMWHRFSISNKWWGRQDSPSTPPQPPRQEDVGRPSLGNRLSKRIVPGLPTLTRQQSERREHLLPVQPRHVERRAFSGDRRRAASSRRASSPQPIAISRVSAPEVSRAHDQFPPYGYEDAAEPDQDDAPLNGAKTEEAADRRPTDTDVCSENDTHSEALGDDNTIADLEDKWILNLSMHFRDRSPREKFFITYAETPSRWRRVTISCDYRDAPPDSLESDLLALQFQREKSARIYESIRESLPDIQFYDTVTNLKLETRDGRLHVHVTEDVNEIIPYPPISTVQNLDCEKIRESDLEFDSHLSGFVYKVKVNTEYLIKKEIPGPDTVDEFLYEINALYALSGAESVIRFRGVIVDDKKEVVKGLLIDVAEHGALVDLIYDNKGSLPWSSRERWAKQIVHGLAEIHEAGFVQGDFTLSNIVIDAHDNAKIIDINRRGCPVGWEPPEISKLIESNQRISMYIGVKSDLFQLGMVLWALAQEVDEPEAQQRPLRLDKTSDEIPHYYREAVNLCLKPTPQERPSASVLLALFPDLDRKREDELALPPRRFQHDMGASHSNPSEKQYIDPVAAVEREDIARFQELRDAQGLGGTDRPEGDTSTGERTYVNPPGSGSYDLYFDKAYTHSIRHMSQSLPNPNEAEQDREDEEERRGRAPATNTLHLDSNPFRPSHLSIDHQHDSGQQDPPPTYSVNDQDADTESQILTPEIIPISPSHTQSRAYFTSMAESTRREFPHETECHNDCNDLDYTDRIDNEPKLATCDQITLEGTHSGRGHIALNDTFTNTNHTSHTAPTTEHHDVDIALDDFRPRCQDEISLPGHNTTSPYFTIEPEAFDLSLGDTEPTRRAVSGVGETTSTEEPGHERISPIRLVDLEGDLKGVGGGVGDLRDVG